MKPPQKYLLANAALALLILSWFCGCVTRSQANAQAREAYMAGQKAALASLAGEGKVVIIEGPVEYAKVPWVEGLTLSQAIASAQYTGRHNPRSITITRAGEVINIIPHTLLTGRAVPLQPGDAVKIRE
jgi:hypothetical protein